jgi:hypothetical protein
MSDNIARRVLLRAMGATVMAAGGFGASQGQTHEPAPWSSGRTAETKGAAERLRLSHAHLRQSVSGRA